MDFLQTIHNGDCIAGMNGLPEGSVDLAFADPPFNIGYKYDVYEDRLASDEYLKWSREWIAALYRVLKPDGTFWLAIGDEYAAELKVESQRLGFHCRSWVIWYYTFGVNCTRKFTRSHAHLFHFVKNPESFTFLESDPANRVPSARQLVYNDKRANSKGRLPDDTWIIPPENTSKELNSTLNNWLLSGHQDNADIPATFALRPQELALSFRPEEDTWYFPRVAGTFHERAGFHGCQMPEQLLGRIVRTCSLPDQIVMDPFSGSASTLVVARKLGRRYVGFELSPEYTAAGLARLDATRAGDPLTGSAEPTMSAPRIGQKSSSGGRRTKASGQPSLFEAAEADAQSAETMKKQLHDGVTRAFRETHEGYSEERVILDPQRNEAFAEVCRSMGLPGDRYTWNRTLLLQRRLGCHADIDVFRSTPITLADCDSVLSASEIACRLILNQERATTVTGILCHPALVAEFDKLAESFAPGYEPLQYRWSALLISTEAACARVRGSVLLPPESFGPRILLPDLDSDSIEASPGVFIVSDEDSTAYVGATLNLQQRLRELSSGDGRAAWLDLLEDCVVQWFPIEGAPRDLLAWVSCIVTRLSPRYNLPDLKHEGDPLEVSEPLEDQAALSVPT